MPLYELTLSLNYAGEDVLDKRKIMADSTEQVIEWGMEQVKTYWGEDGYMEGDVSYREDGCASCQFGGVHEVRGEWIQDLRKDATFHIVEMMWVLMLRESPPRQEFHPDARYYDFLESETKRFELPEEDRIMKLAERWSNWGFRFYTPKNGKVHDFDSYPTIEEAVQGMNNILNDETLGLSVGCFTGPHPIVDGVPFEDWQGEE